MVNAQSVLVESGVGMCFLCTCFVSAAHSHSRCSPLHRVRVWHRTRMSPPLDSTTLRIALCGQLPPSPTQSLPVAPALSLRTRTCHQHRDFLLHQGFRDWGLSWGLCNWSLQDGLDGGQSALCQRGDGERRRYHRVHGGYRRTPGAVAALQRLKRLPHRPLHRAQQWARVLGARARGSAGAVAGVWGRG